MGRRIAEVFCIRVWCASRHDFWNFRFLPSNHHALVDQGPFSSCLDDILHWQRLASSWVLWRIQASTELSSPDTLPSWSSLSWSFSPWLVLYSVRRYLLHIDFCHWRDCADSVKQITEQIGNKSFKEIVENLDCMFSLQVVSYQAHKLRRPPCCDPHNVH